MTEIEVIVYRRPNMFKVEQSIYGRTDLEELEKLFTVEGYKATKELNLYYPERFLNILEQRALADRIRKAGYSKATIITHSVYIVQSVPMVLTVQDEDIQEGKGVFKLSNDSVGCH